MKKKLEYQDVERMCCNATTPFYAYSRNTIKNNYASLRKKLNQEIGLFYAMKANPNHEILRTFCDLETGVMCSSAAEIEDALSNKIRKNDILFISPGKTLQDITCAIKQEIGMIVVDSIEEIDQIAKVAKELNKSTNIGIRLHVDTEKVKAKEVFSAPHFGMDESQIMKAIHLILEKDMLAWKGFHCFFGSQITSERTFSKCFKNYLTMISDILKQIQGCFDKLRLLYSLGIGIDYYNQGKEISIYDIANEINTMWEEFCTVHEQYSLQLDLIAGRFFVAGAGYYISRIIDTKDVYGKNFIITDGGTHQISPTFMLGKFLRSTLPIHTVGKVNQEAKKVTVTGNLLTPTDILGEDVSVQNYTIGDYVIIPNTGAYGRNFSVLDFLSHELPVEILID